MSDLQTIMDVLMTEYSTELENVLTSAFGIIVPLIILLIGVPIVINLIRTLIGDDRPSRKEMEDYWYHRGDYAD